MAQARPSSPAAAPIFRHSSRSNEAASTGVAGKEVEQFSPAFRHCFGSAGDATPWAVSPNSSDGIPSRAEPGSIRRFQRSSHSGDVGMPVFAIFSVRFIAATAAAARSAGDFERSHQGWPEKSSCPQPEGSMGATHGSHRSARLLSQSAVHMTGCGGCAEATPASPASRRARI